MCPSEAHKCPGETQPAVADGGEARAGQPEERHGLSTAGRGVGGKVSEELSEQTGLGKDVAHFAEGPGL